MEEVLVPLIVFSCIFGIFYVYVSARHKERMIMLENGLDLRKLQSKKITLRYFMTLGFLSIGAGIGLIVGLTISNFFYNVFHIYKTYNCYSDTYDYSYLAILPSILVFCGISLILSYLFDKKHTKEEESINIQISE